jgi:iron transport multicopper oxidase
LVLKIINSIDDEISIHSHGLFHRGRNYYDGAKGITQCGIMPGKEFVYDIIIEQTGTFWVGRLRDQPIRRCFIPF